MGNMRENMEGDLLEVFSKFLLIFILLGVRFVKISF